MILFWLALVLVAGFGVAALTGAPYLPVFSRDAEKLLKSLGRGQGKNLVDLGCGDGKVLLIAAKLGYEAVGYEINPIMWLVAWWRTRSVRRQVTVKLGSYWKADMTEFDVVFVFLIERYMERLENKLSAGLKSGAVLVSYVFKLPSKKPFRTTKNAYFYRF